VQVTIHESSPALYGRAEEFRRLAQQLKGDVEELRRENRPPSSPNPRSGATVSKAIILKTKSCSSKHRHNASAFVYVLEGSIVMQMKGKEK
jgi:quercetin dioxygenase-like cupin family protein